MKLALLCLALALCMVATEADKDKERYKEQIIGGLYDGFEINVVGTVEEDAKAFVIQLRKNKNAANIAMAFNPKFKEEKIILRYKEGTVWGPTTKVTSTFGKGDKVDIHIKVLPFEYQITVNGERLADFKHQIPYTEVNYLLVRGDITVEKVNLTEWKRPKKDIVKCDAKIDILFLMDRSASVSKVEFKTEREFVASMIERFTVAPDKTRIGAVLFANDVHDKYNFNNFTTDEAAVSALREISCPECGRGKTATGSAVKYGREVSLKESWGARPGVQKIVVVLTDGRCTEGKKFLKKHATRLQDVDNTQVMAVGVGRLDKKELQVIASTKRLVFLTNDFSKLLGMLDDVAATTCDVTKPGANGSCEEGQCTSNLACIDGTCQCKTGEEFDEKEGKCQAPGPNQNCDKECASNLQCVDNVCQCVKPLVYNEVESKCQEEVPDQCDVPIDMVFMVDTSRSINEEEFSKSMGFVSTVTDSFLIGEDYTHVSVVQVAHIPKYLFSLTTFLSNDAVKQAIKDKQIYFRGSTKATKALTAVASDVFSVKGGARDDAAKVLVFITDGRPNNPSAALTAAADLKKSGVNIITVGLGANVNATELDMMATESLTFHAPDYQDMVDIVKSVTKGGCEISGGVI